MIAAIIILCIDGYRRSFFLLDKSERGSRRKFFDFKNQYKIPNNYLLSDNNNKINYYKFYN